MSGLPPVTAGTPLEQSLKEAYLATQNSVNASSLDQTANSLGGVSLGQTGHQGHAVGGSLPSGAGSPVSYPTKLSSVSDTSNPAFADPSAVTPPKPSGVGHSSIPLSTGATDVSLGSSGAAGGNNPFVNRSGIPLSSQSAGIGHSSANSGTGSTLASQSSGSQSATESKSSSLQHGETKEGDKDSLANLLTGIGGAIVTAPAAAVEAGLEALNRQGSAESRYGDSIANAAGATKAQLVNVAAALGRSLPESHTKNADGSQKAPTEVAASLAGAAGAQLQSGASAVYAQLPPKDDAVAALQQGVEKMKVATSQATTSTTNNAPTSGGQPIGERVSGAVSSGITSAQQTLSNVAATAQSYLPASLGGGSHVADQKVAESSSIPGKNASEALDNASVSAQQTADRASTSAQHTADQASASAQSYLPSSGNKAGESVGHSSFATSNPSTLGAQGNSATKTTGLSGVDTSYRLGSSVDSEAQTQGPGAPINQA